MLKILSRIAIILAAIAIFMALAAPTAADPIIGTAQVESASLGQNLAFDHRYTDLDAFFTKHKCPYRNTAVYIDAADKNSLDWRLMPALSIAEESCGLHNPSNNLFGFYMCIKVDVKGHCTKTAIRPFKTIDDGVYYVADALAHAKVYAGKTLQQKLKVYNSVNPDYFRNVTGLMADAGSQ
jgi:hypothetical protein